MANRTNWNTPNNNKTWTTTEQRVLRGMAKQAATHGMSNNDFCEVAGRTLGRGWDSIDGYIHKTEPSIAEALRKGRLKNRTV